MSENFILNAAGSVNQASALVIQQCQQIRIAKANYEEVMELLKVVDDLQKMRQRMEVLASRYGESNSNGAPVRTASSPRMRG